MSKEQEEQRNTINVEQNHYVSRKTEVACRVLHNNEGAVLYHPDTRTEKYVNATGLFIWQQLCGDLPLSDVITRIGDVYELDSAVDIRDDVLSFIDQINEQGFITTSQNSPLPKLREEKYFSVGDAPQSLDISLTGKCNLRCQYCFYLDEMQTRKDLPFDEWLQFFEEAGSLGVRDLSLSGGEVFTRSDLWELIDNLIDNRMRYSLCTNGTLITEKTLQNFEQEKRFSRLDNIQISIDGSCPEIHDKSRGSGSFEKAVRGLRLLKEAGFPVTVRVTVNRYNVNDLPSVFRLLIEDIGIHSVGTNDVMPMGAGCDNQAAITLTSQQQVQAMKSLAALADQYNGRITAMAGPLAKWRGYQEMEHARETGEKKQRMGYLTACGCMFNKLSVHHDGIITPCNMLTELKMGRINHDSLSHIWKNHDYLKKLKDRRSIPMTDVPGCEDCEWTPYCNGSCPGLAFELTGDVNQANPHDCYRNFIESTGFRFHNGNT